MEYASAAAFLLSQAESHPLCGSHMCFPSLPPCLTSPSVNQSPSPLRPLGDSNDTALPLWGLGMGTRCNLCLHKVNLSAGSEARSLAGGVGVSAAAGMVQ